VSKAETVAGIAAGTASKATPMAIEVKIFRIIPCISRNSSLKAYAIYITVRRRSQKVAQYMNRGHKKDTAGCGVFSYP
jgi:hypothetical protein